MPDHDTLTLYFCGSGNKRTQIDKFLIPYLYAETQGRSEHMFDRGARAAIFDGPGGSWFLRRLKYSNIYNVLFDNSEFTERAFTEDELRKAMHVKENGKLSYFAPRNKFFDMLSGGGTVSNVVMAWAWLVLQMKRHPERYKRINIVGFSRGGHSALILPHLLQKDPRFAENKMKVNVFAFDPVPGGKNTSMHWVNDQFRRKYKFRARFDIPEPLTLPPIVDNYFTVVQQNIIKSERQHFRPFGLSIPHIAISKDHKFQCIVPEWQDGTHKTARQRVIVPMPGHHSASVKMDTKYAPSFAIGRHLCETFLTEHGTVLNCNNRLTDREILAHYQDLQERCEGTVKSPAGYSSTPSKHRAFVADNLPPTGRFLNEHHLSLFDRVDWARAGRIAAPATDAGAG
ncbi:MAG: hypothetical protein AAF899_17450, partial [Pseudomonadota bacterium]